MNIAAALILGAVWRALAMAFNFPLHVRIIRWPMKFLPTRVKNWMEYSFPTKNKHMCCVCGRLVGKHTLNQVRECRPAAAPPPATYIRDWVWKNPDAICSCGKAWGAHIVNRYYTREMKRFFVKGWNKTEWHSSQLDRLDRGPTFLRRRK